MYTILQYITPTHVVFMWFLQPLLRTFTSLCLQLFCMSVQMCECDYLHSCVSVVTNLRGYAIVCFAASLRASRSEETPKAPHPNDFPLWVIYCTSPTPIPSTSAPPLPLLLPSLPTTLWIKKKLMQMMHSLSHCLFHSVDGYRDDSNIGETTDVKLLAWLEGVCVHSVQFMCMCVTVYILHLYLCVWECEREREREYELWQMPCVFLCVAPI